MAKVALTAGKSRKENVREALELIREEIDIRGRVLIKPNLSSLKNEYANTSLEAVEGVIEFLNDRVHFFSEILRRTRSTILPKTFHRNFSL